MNAIKKTDDGNGKLWNPYVAGISLGLVLLAAFVIIGQGLGASGGVGRMMVAGVSQIAPEFVKESAYFGRYVADGANPIFNYLVFLGLGVLLGGYLGAFTGGANMKMRLEKGPHATTRSRVISALGGGIIMGFAARLAYGCTSGQALTGGATLAAGSWVFMFAVFGGGYALAWFLRRQWL